MANWRFLLSLLKPHAKWAMLGFFLALCALAANITLLALSGWFLAAMAAAGIAGLTMNYFTPAGLIRFLAIVRTASGYAQRLVNHNTTFLVLKTLRVQVFSALVQKPMHSISSVGRHISQLQEDIELLDEFYIGVLIPILLALTGIAVIALVIGNHSIELMWLVVAALITVGVILPAWLSRSLQGVGNATLRAQTQLSECLVEGTRGLKELQLAGASDAFWQRIAHAQQQLDTQQRVAHKWYATHQGLTTLVSNMTIIGALLILIPMVNTEQVVNVNLAMLVLLVLASFESVVQLPDALLKLELTLASAGRLNELLSERDGERIANDTPRLTGDNNAAEIFSLRDVNIAYAEQPALFEHLDFTLGGNSKVALVGRSGAGKSTLLKVLTAQLGVQRGCAQAYHQELKHLDKEWLYERLGVLNQYSHTFNASIRDNLLLANPQATDEQLWQALHTAQLKSLVESMPLKLDTLLGVSARQLSSGEARRLHLAQLLLREPQVLVLDEPTRGLDNINQQHVFSALLTMAQTRTLVVSTHDSQLLAAMDQVIWIDQGRIRAQGSHTSLCAQYDEYRALTLRI